MKKGLIIAIDGPAGSGKSTIAQLLAKKLGYVYIDTGAMYRAVTLKALRKKINLNNNKLLTELAQNTDITLKSDKDHSLKIFLDEEDVTRDIREPRVTNNVSYIATIPTLRAIMVKKQRALGEDGSIVIEGRDITTIVFPDADRKFYLDASFRERLKRRYKQLISEGKEISMSVLEGDMNVRDKEDRRRKVGALKKAEDAIFIDTTDLTFNQVVEKIISQIK